MERHVTTVPETNDTGEKRLKKRQGRLATAGVALVALAASYFVSTNESAPVTPADATAEVNDDGCKTSTTHGGGPTTTNPIDGPTSIPANTVPPNCNTTTTVVVTTTGEIITTTTGSTSTTAPNVTTTTEGVTTTTSPNVTTTTEGDTPTTTEAFLPPAGTVPVEGGAPETL